jgi:3-deoxy-D-manno-octulosonic-acid transferase
MEGIKEAYPHLNLIITFFSPSCFEVRKGYPLAHYVGYLPLDTVANAQLFLELTKPKLVVFVKSEIWPNFISAIKRRGVPSLLISARFYEKQSIFTRKGRLFLRALAKFDFIFVQDKISQKLLKKHNMYSILAGDTRYDTVLKTKKSSFPLPYVDLFVSTKRTWVIGSCWEEDLDVLFDYINDTGQHIKVIIAPHDISQKMTDYIKAGLKVPFVSYSDCAQLSESVLKESKVMIVDCIGILSHLYRYAHVSYIGGAFKQGLHNILEPAVFGSPVIIGPIFDKFPEATEMIASAGVFSIQTKEQLHKKMDQLLLDENYHSSVSDKNIHYMEGMAGATSKIMTTVKMLLENKVNT